MMQQGSLTSFVHESRTIIDVRNLVTHIIFNTSGIIILLDSYTDEKLYHWQALIRFNMIIY